VNDKNKPLRGLGRGLDALLPARPPPPQPRPDGAPPVAYSAGDVFRCPVDKIIPQKGQPRQHFDPQALAELTASIQEHGLLEPLVVRRLAGQDRFELIAGERRWKASQRAGLTEVLVVVRDVSPATAFELALIENIQRADLDPIEFAEAIDRLLKEHDYTQEALAQRVGKDRSTVANALRLLKLPPSVRSRVVNAELSEGHARALLGLVDEKQIEALAEKVVRGRLSVRDTEAQVRQLKKAATAGKDGPAAPKGKTASVRDLETRLARKLGAPCEVRDRQGKGEVVIRYASLDDLDRILDVIL
jgi:ParB family chromosome partitioning protein